MAKVEGLTIESLSKTFRRLKKYTKRFSTLVVRDVIDYLDFEVNLDKNLQSLVSGIENNEYRPQKPRLLESPKGKGINRPTVVFGINDSLVYRFCIEQIQDDLFRKTRMKNVRGGTRIKASQTPEGDTYYEKWFKDWKEHNDSIAKALKTSKYVATTDIASYFEHISLLVLKDLIRGDVEGKQKVINILFYFLEGIRFSDDYEVNTFTGLPQEDIDCSRTLAYYFLNPLDKRLIKFSSDEKAEYYRFVDDMNIVVKKEVQARKALKAISCSLRKLGLMSSIEKTQILESNKALEELFYDENNTLTSLEDEIVSRLKNRKSIKEPVQETLALFTKLKKEKSSKRGWVKVLKRFYTIFSYAKVDILLDSFIEDLIYFPTIALGPKITKYILRNKKSPKFNVFIEKLISYLYSRENLYPSIETNILETLLYLDKKDFSKKALSKLRKLSDDIFYIRNYSPLSEYTRSLACLMIYRFNRGEINKLCRHYLTSEERDYLLKKYLVTVCLTCDNHNFRKKIIEKAKKEQNQSIANLLTFVENLRDYKRLVNVKSYFRKSGFYIYTNKETNFLIIEKYIPVRAEIVKSLVAIYS